MRTILKNQHDKTSATTQDHEIGILYSQRNIDVAQICGNTQKCSAKYTSKKKFIAGEKKKIHFILVCRKNGLV